MQANRERERGRPTDRQRHRDRQRVETFYILRKTDVQRQTETGSYTDSIKREARGLENGLHRWLREKETQKGQANESKAQMGLVSFLFRERERGGGGRQTDGQRQKQRDGDWEREGGGGGQETDRQRKTDRDRKTDRQTDETDRVPTVYILRQTETQRQTDRQAATQIA